MGFFPTNKDQIFPFLMTVAYKEGGINHMIAGRAYNDKSLQIIDSLKNEIIITDVEHLYEIYPVIFGIFAFQNNDVEAEGYMMLSAD